MNSTEIKHEAKDKAKDKAKDDIFKFNDNYNNITVMNSIKENYPSFLCIFIAVFILSSENFFLGIITFCIIIFLSYNDHNNAHKVKNIFSIIHHYHHENNNFFSHFIQVLLELTVIGVFVPLYYIFGTIFLNPWILIFFIVFYSSVHNINYSICRVNKVHKLHHEFTETNVGPDILDIIFGTKHTSEKCVENTNHYIPNIIVSTLFVLLLKHFWSHDDNKKYMLFALNSFLLTSFSILITTSIYLWNYQNTKTN
jgi:hypothetical protein